MSITHVNSIDKEIDTFNIWISEIKSELECSNQDAYIALYATLHTLREKLNFENIVYFGTQLPLIIKGIYYSKWIPKKKPEKIDKQSFIKKVHSHFNNDPLIEPEVIIQKIIYIIQKHINKDEITHLKSPPSSEIKKIFDILTTEKS